MTADLDLEVMSLLLRSVGATCVLDRTTASDRIVQEEWGLEDVRFPGPFSLCHVFLT